MIDRRQPYKDKIAIALLALVVLVSSLALVRSLDTLGKNFGGFLFSPDLVVTVGQRVEWNGIQDGVRPGDRVLAIDGQRVRDGAELARAIAARHAGDIVRYSLLRGDAVVDAKVEIGENGLGNFIVVFLFPFLLGLLFVFFGAMLYFFDFAPRGRLVYLVTCCLIGATCASMHEALTTFTLYPFMLFYPLIGALSCHLFSLFPESRMHDRRVRVLIVTLYAATALLGATRFAFERDPELSDFLAELAPLLVFACVGVDAFFLADGYRQTQSQSLRDKIKVMGIGLVIAAVFVLTWTSSVLSSGAVFPLDAGMLLAAVFPLFMAYAIVRNNVFQLDRIIRAGLSNGAAAIFVFSIYLGVVTALRYLFPNRSGALFQWFWVAFFFFLGFVFNHLRLWINAWVQRTLFRSRHSFEGKMQDLDRLLLSGEDPRALAARIGADLRTFLELDRSYAVLISERYPNQRLIFAFPADPENALDRAFPLLEAEGLVAHLAAGKCPLRRAALEAEHPGSFRASLAALASMGVTLAVPVASGARLHAILFLGKKASRDGFDAADLEQLQKLADRFGIVLDNAELTHEGERQARLAELGKMASILIHDIKNPLSTIRISAGALRKRFKKDDPSHELATFIEEEVVRMNRTVQEILTYAKPVGVRLAPCSIHAILSALAARLARTAEAKGLAIALDFAPRELAVEADANRLERAFENLIVNAIEASEAPGGITVSTVLVDAGGAKPRMRVDVRDRGKGMDPAIRDQVFKPFFTTKPSGTGLGLAIVRQVADEHGATIELESQRGAGTRFVLTFRAMNPA